MDDEDPYLCIGVCMADPDSGYCLGCGRPPLGAPAIVVAEVAPPPKAEEATGTPDPDTPA